MRTIKETVHRLISKHGTNDPFEIAAQKNVIILFENLGEILGYYNTYKRIQMIHINQDSDQTEQRFTCAHELGHCIFHPRVNTPFLRKNTLYSIDRIEREANAFAVELLMPDCRLNEYKNSSITIYDAADLCGVPRDLVRLKKL